MTTEDPTNCHVYYVAGLNDLTRMDSDYHRSSRFHYEEVTFVESPDKAVQRLCDLVDHICQHTLFLGAKPCFATIPPASLTLWNYHRLWNNATTHLLHSDHYDDMQELLIQSIEKVNLYLNQVNESNQMVTPDLAGTILDKRRETAKRA